MADLLSSIMELLMPSAHAATPPPEGAAVPAARFSPNGQLLGDKGPPLPGRPQFATAPGAGEVIDGPQPTIPMGPPQRPMPATPPGVTIGAPPSPGAPVADEIRKLFAPAYAPPPPPEAQQAPAGPNPITGADVQRFVRSVATGAGRANPGAPKTAAFMQGGMGSLQNSYGEIEAEKKQATADKRADRALAAQVARDQRAEEELARRNRRDDRVDAERQVRIKERLERIARADDQRLRPQDIGNFNRDINSRMSLLQRQVRELTKTPEQAEKELEDYRRQLVEQYLTRNPGAKPQQPGAPAAPAKPNTGAVVPGQIYRFNGKQYRLKPGVDPSTATQADFEEVK